MVESASLLVDDILPEAPIRQWVVSFPYALRFLFATCPAVMGKVLILVCRKGSFLAELRAAFGRQETLSREPEAPILHMRQARRDGGEATPGQRPRGVPPTRTSVCSAVWRVSSTSIPT